MKSIGIPMNSFFRLLAVYVILIYTLLFCGCASTISNQQTAPDSSTPLLSKASVDANKTVNFCKKKYHPEAKRISCRFYTEAGELTPLIEMKKLKKLSIHGKIKDFMPLKELAGLEILDLSETNIVDLTPLKNISELKVLNLYRTNVTDLTPVEGLTKLEVLSLSETQISNLAPLIRMKKLQHLSLGATPVEDLSPLKDLKELKSLGLRRSRVIDITPLKDLDKLEILNLSETQVADLIPLKGLKKLYLNVVSIHLFVQNAEENVDLWRS
jgi:Leucine-rich repeat (LRR) protein